MTGLTERQAAVWKFIRESTAARGYPPSMREIAAHMGIRSTNGVNDHLRALERKGFLRRNSMTSRGLVAIDPSRPDLVPAQSPASRWEPSFETKLRAILSEYNVIATCGGRLVADFAGELARKLELETRNS